METFPVIFRAEKSGDFKGEVTAVFPTIKLLDGSLSCYSHIGQHEFASVGWYRRTRCAKPKEYASLLAELTRIYTTNVPNDMYDQPVRLVIQKRLVRR